MIDFSKLKEPFYPSEIEWRLQSCGETNCKIWGICLAYVTNRAIQNRLDEVCGPQNWKNEYAKAPDGGILCGISIKVDGEWITKYDGAENTQVEAVKGGLSDSMKRCAVQWGMGRYLYNLETGFIEVSEDGKYSGKTKNGTFFKWNPPKLPAWATPKEKANEKEFEELVIALEQNIAAGVIPKEKVENVNKAIKEKNVSYIKSVLTWCMEQNIV